MDEEPPSRVPASRGPLLYRGAHTLPVARRADERSGAPRSEVALLTFFGLESGIDAEPCGVSVDAVEPRSGAVCSLDIGQDRLAPLARAGHSAVHELMKQWLGVHRQHRERLRPGEWVRVIRSLVVPQFVFALASGAPARYRLRLVPPKLAPRGAAAAPPRAHRGETPPPHAGGRRPPLSELPPPPSGEPADDDVLLRCGGIRVGGQRMLVSVRVICGKVIEVEAVDPSGGAPLTCMVGPRAWSVLGFGEMAALDHAERQRLVHAVCSGLRPVTAADGSCTGLVVNFDAVAVRSLPTELMRIGADAQLDLENYCESTYALVRRESLEHAKNGTGRALPPPSSSPAAGAVLESPAPDWLWPQLQEANDAPPPPAAARPPGDGPGGEMDRRLRSLEDDVIALIEERL